MTRIAVVRQLYGQNVERRPFSRFTADPSKRQANAEWAERARAWGDIHVDAYGHYQPDRKARAA